MARDSIYLLLIFTVIYLSHPTFALPRDSSVIKKEFLAGNDDVATSEVKEISPPIILTSDLSGLKIPGRLSCPHEEATEDPSCLEHCLPKGYSYGLCVNRMCSCI